MLDPAKKSILLAVVLLFSMLTSLHLPWNDWVESATVEMNLRIRGPRQMPDDIILVFIGLEDVRALGGWPVTRDYYSYMTHTLRRLGARVIAFNLLFDSPRRERK